MLPQISRKALLQLGNEVNKRGFTPFTLNRLKNENPRYAYLAHFFAQKAKTEIGDHGFRLALDHFAVFYRILELSERYPDQKQIAPNTPERDPLEIASREQLAETASETEALIKRHMLPPKNEST